AGVASSTARTKTPKNFSFFICLLRWDRLEQQISAPQDAERQVTTSIYPVTPDASLDHQMSFLSSAMP
ncbi:MAG: hypothetical protein P8Y74_18715, partial [Desulfobacterales bacterium]